MLNIIKSNVEQTCFCCPVVTRFIIITSENEYPMCLDCLMIYEELMIKYQGFVKDFQRIERHLNN